MESSVVLLSGGQDSTTCLYWALARGHVVAAVSFDYGQRHRFELEAAKEIAAGAGVKHYLLSMPVLSELSDSDLIAGGSPIKADGGYKDREAPNGLPTSFVPGRNALFLTAASALAVKLGANRVVTGVCQTDYSGYPDCRLDFVRALEVAVNLALPSGCGPIAIDTPLMHATKAETVAMAMGLDGCYQALAKSVTCYYGKRPGCGVCPACTIRAKGFADAGYPDPAQVETAA